MFGDEPNSGYPVRRAVQPVDEHNDVVEDAVRRDARAAHFAVHDGLDYLVTQVAPIRLSDAQRRAEDARLVAAPWMLRIEGISDELLGRDDRLSGTR